MPQVYVTDSGVIYEPKEIFVHNNGAWNAVREIYIKQNGSWLQTYPRHDSMFLNSGSGTFSVPAGIYSLTVSYPTASGITTQTLSVTPGDNISYNIAGFGYSSTFGSITAPVFDTTVFSISCQVDAVLKIIVSCATANGTAITIGGGNFDLSPWDIIWSIQQEVSHGQQYKNITVAPVPTAVCQGPLQAYVSSGSGRDRNWSTYIQPTAQGDGYVFGAYIQDAFNDQSGYNVSWNLQQQVPFTVSW